MPTFVFGFCIALLLTARSGVLNYPLGLFALGALLGCLPIAYGLGGVAFVLPIVSGLHQQIKLLFGMNIVALPNPGFELLLGFFFVALIRLYKGRRSWFIFNPSPPIWGIFHLFLMFSTILAIGRNLWQDASVLSLKGIAFNLLNARQLGWHDSYFPLEALFSISLGMFLLPLISAHRNQVESITRKVLAGVLLAGVVSGLYAGFQYFFHIGYAKSSHGRGVQGFVPDLHAFASFMIIPLFVFIGLFLVKQKPTWKLLSSAGIVLCAFAIFGSGSRFAVFAVPIVIFGFLLVLLIRKIKRGWLYAAVLTPVLIAGGFWGLRNGYKSVDLDRIVQTIRQGTFDDYNRLFTYRLDIYRAALHMVQDYPLVGLGNGTFYRTGAIAGYSKSDYLLKVRGENAHNYFLQVLAELGVIGFVLWAWIVMRPLGVVRSQYDRILLAMLVAIALGNIFGHSLLVREFLFLAFIILGILWGKVPHHSPSTNEKGKATSGQKAMKRWMLALIAVCLLFAVTLEVKKSFDSPPFVYGTLCFREAPVTKDGWTSGFYVKKWPNPTSQDSIINLKYEHGHSDVGRRPLTVYFQALGPNKNLVYEQSLIHHSEVITNYTFELPAYIDASEVRYFAIKTSRCLIPRNLGINGDPRRLGINLKEISIESEVLRTLPDFLVQTE
jgi:O-antigen ligase